MHIISGCSNIEDCIRLYGTDARTCFVFPSRIAGRLWLHRSLTLTGLPAIPAELFTAWDAFKADCCIAQAKDKSPASQVIRLLFAHHIAAANASAAQPFLHSVIPSDYAADGTLFAQWIAGILPQLDHWEKRTAQHGEVKDEETADLHFLKKAYMDFLDSHRLFEPSWVGAEFIPLMQRYILVYPELMEDFEEYRALLSDREEVFVLPAPPFKPEAAPLIPFDTMREEIHSTVHSIEQLLAGGIPADDIALSVAGIEDTVPYLKREFALRNIPAEFRLGFKLSEQQAGRLFPLLEQCVRERYSFESLKPLLLNPHIPWKHPQQIQAVISFGIKNNCLVSWKDGNQYRNVWKEAFKLPIPYNPESSFEEEQAERDSAKEWLLPFMKAAERLVQAQSFSDVQRQYILFRNQYFDIDGFSSEDDAVIGRCVTLMRELVQLEPDFTDCLPDHPYHFFTAQLAREIYVPQNTGRAVAIFPFRVAAATPFAYHFVLNCNQKASRVLYQKLPFLRKDKRDALGIIEKDATQDFFAVYAGCGRACFSVPEQTFSGFTVGNGIFTVFAPRPDYHSGDSLEQEYAFFKQNQSLPQALYPVQKTGFEQFAGIKKERTFSFLTVPFNGTLPPLTRLLATDYYEDGAFRISQSGLALFSDCAAKWFLSSVLHINEEDTDAELFNPRYIGIICHRILEQLYLHIRETDKVFSSAHLSDYTAQAQVIFDEIVHSQTDFRGPLAAPFIESIKKRSLKSVAFVLAFDAEKLDGYAPYLMEGKLQHRSGGLLYYGLIDRIAYQEGEGRIVLLDYKSGTVPAATDYTPEAMRDFQIPMYVFLAEQELFKQEVAHAFFLDITKEDIKYIVNDKEAVPQGLAHSKTREEFEPSVQAFLHSACGYAEQVKMEDFRKQPTVQWQDCAACAFHAVCRTPFTVGE